MFSKSSVFLVTLLFFTLTSLAQSVAVTFQVDMSKESISNDGIHIAGSFQSVAGFGDNWNPSTTRLDDTDGDKVYSLTLEMPSGTYEYKFINGKEWGKDENPPVECSVGNTNNRVITVGDKDLVIPSVPFNGCVGMIKLAVNMNGETVSPEGVHVMGNFQKAAGYETDWDASSTKLVDVNGDNTYEVNLMLPAGNYEYLFVNGNESLDTESLPLDCSIEGENGTNNRTLTVELGSANPPIYCFNSCDECNPNLNTDYDTHWWNDAVFYELFVRSFYDSDGDGIGDFRGIIEKLDYLNDGDPNTDKDLGITAIWLMPMMESPSYHGYDATDYYKTEPDYGTMEDFTAFLEEAHNRGIKVIIDLVLNHTSNQHPWFTQSKTNSNGFRDWYIWSEDNPNFSGPWGQGVWHGSGSDYYYGLFWSGMPDLNYNHPDVKEEMFNVANFWLDKGVDGFRLDAIKYLIEDGTVLENTSGTFSLLEEFDEVYKSNNADAFSIGEVWSNTASIIPYVQNERLDVCFEFDLAGHILNAVINENSVSVRQQMLNVNASYPSLQYGTFLSNHDMDRVYDILGSSVSKLKLAASIYLTLPGIPFLYYGEEVNMSGTGAHENIRRPMQWSDAANAGFSTSTPWNNAGSNYVTNNVVVMENNPNSLLNHYKRLIRIRNEQKALRRGYYLDVESSEANVYSFARIYENEGIVVVSNLATQLSNASLSLKASTLLPGNYKVTDLYNDEEMGMISINEKGGFENWESTTEMSAQSTRVLLISDVNSVSTNNISKAFFDFKLSPNPTIDEVNISWESAPEPRANVKVISTNGAIIYQETSSDNAMTIQTKGWSSGIYFVQITVDGKIGSQRLVIL